MQPKYVGRRDYLLSVTFVCLYLSYHPSSLLVLLKAFPNINRSTSDRKIELVTWEAGYSSEVPLLVLIVKISFSWLLVLWCKVVYDNW